MNRTSRDPRDTRTVRTSFRKYMGRYWQLYAIMLVPVCYFLLFKYVPMLGNILAFRRFKPLTGPYGVSWAQPPLRYFRQFMGQEGFWQAFRNTLIISVENLAVNFPFPMCNAELAFPFMDFFFGNLKDASIGEVDGQRIPLYCCGGICFMTEESDFHTAFTMAEKCCESAKKTAKLEKNLRNGLAGNWIDFQICDSAYYQELDLLREKSFVTDENVNLALRPYCLDEAARDCEYAYGRFRERVRALHRLKREYGMRRVIRLGEGYSLERIVYMEQLHRLKEKGIDLEALLGAPFYRDDNKNTFATWYDALTVMPFIPEAPACPGKGGPNG